MPDLYSMIGKEVEVIANGMRYTGRLIEVSEVEVNLKGSFQWISLPTASVSEIRPLGAVRRPMENDPEREGLS